MPAEPRPPSVDALARALASTRDLPHAVLVDVARAAIASGRVDDADALAGRVDRSLVQRVVNATGVLLHTNLGRAPLALPDREDFEGYATVEIDLSTGERGPRSPGVEHLLRALTGCQAALVVNNGAAAVLLALTALAAGRDVVVSRGELVEIGGGFRIPDVLASSGARLVEVGTTNRTRLADHARAIAAPNSDVAALLVVHQSNFRMTGFTERARIEELVALGPPVIVDLGSGLLDSRTPWLAGGPPEWLAGEPGARQTLAAGAALVTFSGDKLLGGPQAGVIAGRADLVAACARHPLARALRPGRLVSAALEQTLLALARRQPDAVPFWRMATVGVGALRQRAEAVAARAGGGIEVVECAALTGGGTLPGVELASAGVALAGDHTAALRSQDPPIVARVERGRTVCDLRTVDPSDDAALSDALRRVAPTAAPNGQASGPGSP